MNSPPRIYLDNAATSWPKPESVYRAVDEYQRQLGAAAGRSGYREAIEVQRRIAACRKRLAEFIGARRPDQIVWTCNGTDALNLALRGLLKPGDHVVTTVTEHNSVLRPLHFLSETQGITKTIVGCDASGYVDPAEIQNAITAQTKLIAVSHASNVTGAVQPIEAIGQLAKAASVRFLVDAAQSVGHVPIDVHSSHIDLLAAPAHKGLYGPLGLGFLYIAPGVEADLIPLRFGGTGTQSDEDSQPESMPERYESGNLNVPAILGLEAGLKEVQSVGLEQIHQQEQAWSQMLLEGLQQIPDLEVFGPAADQPRVGVVSFRHLLFDPRDFAAALDATHGIQTRSGIHCAPKMHQSLGTLPAGTVRLSIGWHPSTDELATVLAAIRDVCDSCAW